MFKVETRDALLHAIDEEYVEAVEVLLENEEMTHKEGDLHVCIITYILNVITGPFILSFRIIYIKCHNDFLFCSIRVGKQYLLKLPALLQILPHWYLQLTEIIMKSSKFFWTGVGPYLCLTTSGKIFFVRCKML